MQIAMKNAIWVLSIFFATTAIGQVQKDSATQFTSVHGTVWAMTTINGSLYMAGTFDSVGGIAASNIARWNGTNWSPIGAGIRGVVRALIDDGFGGLYAGGKFDSAGGIATSNIAHWDGVRWNSLGGGVNDTVFAFYRQDSDLYCGGAFTFAEDLGARRVAKWKNGWDTLSINGLNGTVRGIGTGFGFPWIVGEFTANYSDSSTRFSNFGLSNKPLYCISTLYGFPVVGGERQFFSFLTYGTPYHNLNWLNNIVVNGTVYGIAPLNSKSFFMWGNFDTIDQIPIPKIGFFDGMKWMRLQNFVAGQVTSVAWIGGKAFFAVKNDSTSSEIFSYLYSNVIIAHYSTFNNYAAFDTISNDSASNNDLLFHYAWGYSFNCYCRGGCDVSGSLKPGETTVIVSTVDPEERADWWWQNAEIDNSTNQSTPMLIDGSGSLNRIQSSVKASESLSINQATHGIIITIPEDDGACANIEFFDEAGRCIKSTEVHSANPTFISLVSFRGLLWVRAESKNSVVMRSIILE